MLQKLILVTSLLRGASALALRRQSACSFHLRTDGALAAPVGQFDSGQARAGPGETPANFTVTGDTVTDAQGRGCWWTPPALVLQCDAAQGPEAGFTIACDGAVSFKGQSTFYACDTGADDLAMISLAPHGSPCGEVRLYADGCFPGSCGASPTASSGTSTSTNTLPLGGGTPGSSCPGDLSPGAYEFPHLIIPLDSANPSFTAGTSYFGAVNATVSTAFTFDIPTSATGKTCTAVFYLPTQSQLETSSYNLTGSGAVRFARLEGAVSEGTSYASLPAVAEAYNETTLVPGNAYTVAALACPAGGSVTFEMSGAGGGGNATDFRYFQDYNPCPIGLYVTVS
ncbi:ubiquitin 3 binding protein But2 C-terminal domain-containing protein [Hypoxylon argillaceum]|nr:ubiquitin 3 binding protein But2 C-terminal domain-containing protein [Hypoxylon argillaceum]